MNFNLNLQVEKVMNKLAESKALRMWTYKVMIGVALCIMLWQSPLILASIAKLIEVTK